MKYRKKAIEVEAWQCSTTPIPDWAQSTVYYLRGNRWFPDWMVLLNKYEIVFLKDEDFNEQYEAVE